MQNNKRIIILLTIYLFLNISFFTYSSQTKLIGNYVKMVVANNDGRFLFYGRNSIHDDWSPLFFEDDPSTTFFRFFNNQFLIPFGEEGYGKNSGIDIVGNKIVYYWENNKIRIEVNYQLIPSAGEIYADTLIIDLKVKSLNDWKYNIDYYFCMDTYLGESDNKHFVIDDNKIVENEYEITNTKDLHSITSFNKEKYLGINIDLNNSIIDPDKIYFANWKRIDNSIGLYNVIDKRSFDLKPYSVNDSAVGFEYRNKYIESDKEHVNRFIIHVINNKKKSDNIDAKADEIKSEKSPDKYNPDKNNNIKNFDDFNFDDLLDILDNINLKIRSNEPLTEKDVDFYNKLIEEIKIRRNKKN